MATVPTLTYRDAVRHVIDWLGASVTEQSMRDARRAVRNAYREIAQAARWSYTYTRGRLDTVASYTTGTITYTNSSRAVTLASGTWPSWAAYGAIAISNVAYEIASRDSNTQITLSVNSNPGADVAAGTAYTLYRDSYPLPSDFLSMGVIVEATNQHYPDFVHPNEWIERQRLSKSPGTPIVYSIISDQNYLNILAWRCHPPPSSVYHYDYIYQRRLRPLVYDEVSAGTATNTASSTTTTGTGTAFLSAHIGSIIRLSSDSTNQPEGLEWQNPYAEERVITAFTSATSVTVDTAWTSAHTGVKYIISDPVDVEDGAMMNAFLRCCEKQVATSKTMRSLGQAEKAYMDALILAREADSRNFTTLVQGYGGHWRIPLRDMPISFS